MREITVLIVEDGREYHENLTRFVPGPRYLEAHNGAEALEALRAGGVDIVYLDMRFDRIPEAELLGDYEAVRESMNGDPARAWRHLKNNQGLFILDALRRAGFGRLPIVLAYDFSRETRRFEHLARALPRLCWVPDAVTPEAVAGLFEALSR